MGLGDPSLLLAAGASVRNTMVALEQAFLLRMPPGSPPLALGLEAVCLEGKCHLWVRLGEGSVRSSRGNSRMVLMPCSALGM